MFPLARNSESDHACGGGSPTRRRAGKLAWSIGLAVATALSARAQDAVAPPAFEVAVPDAEYALPTRLDRIGRVLAPVMVNGQGPFRFILDTGANRSVLSPELAELLHLAPSADRPIGVQGVTGYAILPAVEIEELRAGDLVLARNKRMPVLSREVLANADGILGIEGLAGARIEIDFAEDRVTIGKSNYRPAPSGMVTIPVKLAYGGLLTTRAMVGRQHVIAIIDTGAERSLGNLALRDALQFASQQETDAGGTTVLGATPEIGEGTSLMVPRVQIGTAELRGLKVTFGDLHVFRIWKLEKEPALLIGMDLLGTVQRLVIDYRRREIQVKP